MSRPQEVQYGKQPAAPATVVFGKAASAEETVSTVPGQDAPPEHPSPEDGEPAGDPGIVAESQGGDPPPAPARTRKR